MANRPKAVTPHIVEQRIYLARGQKVMLDRDLAELYGVETKALNQAVKRNRDRFPSDFMFQLTAAETQVLRSQFVTSNESRGGRRYRPYAFTEHGVAMLSSVLKSRRAVRVNIMIVRAFMKLREILATHKELARRLEDLERKYHRHDQELLAVFEAIRKLLAEPPGAKRRIGFVAGAK
jgi:hypothetical protein